MMTTSSYTPGPWALRKNVFGFVDAPDGPVAYISNNPQETGAGRHRPEREANARLIAAAPELVAALERAVRGQVMNNWATAGETICLVCGQLPESGIHDHECWVGNALPLLARVRGESEGGEGA